MKEKCMVSAAIQNVVIEKQNQLLMSMFTYTIKKDIVSHCLQDRGSLGIIQRAVRCIVSDVVCYTFYETEAIHTVHTVRFFRFIIVAIDMLL